MPTDLELIESVEMRFAMADSPQKFAATLKQLLPATLVKVLSQQAQVLPKILSVLSHINRRLKTLESSTPPHTDGTGSAGNNEITGVESVLNELVGVWNMSLQKQAEARAQSHANLLQSATLLAHLTLGYIEMGFKKAPLEQACALLPEMCRGMAALAGPFRYHLMAVLMSVLVRHWEYQQTRGHKSLMPRYWLTTLEERDARVVMDVMLDVMLYQVLMPQVAQQRKVVSGGLSLQVVDHLTQTGKAEWTQDGKETTRVKMGILKCLLDTDQAPFWTRVEDIPKTTADSVRVPGKEDSVPSSPRTPPVSPSAIRVPVNKQACITVQWMSWIVFLAAQCDSYHEVVSLGEEGLRKRGKPDMEQQAFIQAMYALYLGNVNSNQPHSVEASAQPNARFPASISLKVRLLGQLSKSVVAANTLPSMIQVIFDAIYGEKTSHKLRLAGMSFVQWVAKMARDETLAPIGAVLLSGLVKLTQMGRRDSGNAAASLGHVTTGVSAAEEESVRCFAFVSIGLLSKRCPDLFHSDLSILKLLFEATATEESNNVRMAVQEALSMMKDAYKHLTSSGDASLKEDVQALKQLLLDAMFQSEHQARYAAISYIVSLFEFGDVFARYCCLAAAADAKLEIREKGLAGLKFDAGAKKSELNFDDMLRVIQFYVFDQRISQANLPKMSGDQSQSDASGGSFLKQVKVTTGLFSVMVRFMRVLLVVNAYPDYVATQVRQDGTADDIQLYLASGADFALDDLARQAVRKHMSAAVEEGFVMVQEPSLNDGGLLGFLKLLEVGLTDPKTDGALQLECSDVLTELVSLAPISLLKGYHARLDWARDLLGIGKMEARQNTAHFLGLIAGAVCDDDSAAVKTLIKTMLDEIDRQLNGGRVSSELVHGLLCGVGYTVGKIAYRFKGDFSKHVEETAVKRAVDFAMAQLLAGDSIIQSGALTCMSEMLRYGHVVVESETVKKFLQHVLSLVSNEKNDKIMEQCFTALAHVCVGFGQESETVIQTMFELLVPIGKQPNIVFSTGEALASICGGWQASCMAKYLDYQTKGKVIPAQDASDRNNLVISVLDKLLAEYVLGVDGIVAKPPATRKPVCVWLLSLTKFCAGMEPLKQRLTRIHSAFSVLLTDRDEFTQEVAGKGIGLVYELGDKSLKEELVKNLVGSFGEGSSGMKVTGETQIFDANALGSTPDGSTITTYKELCSLASELNKPDLVYKFMSLASHNHMWNSRKGAAFGFSHILALSQAELKPMLPSLIPKLYRYSFDPNQKVSEAMKNIWHSLVRDPKKAVDEYYDVIMKDVLNGMGDRLWRTRESSCLAISDLIGGREMHQFQPYLEDLWQMCFRGIDDIKESVRKAAFTATRTLTTITLRNCDPQQVSVSVGRKTMAIIVPYMLNKGLISNVSEVQKFSLMTILTLCNKSGVLLRPHLAEIIPTLIEGLSSFEPQSLNYLAFHVESKEALEATRFTAAKMSPMMEGAEHALEHLDLAALQVMTPKIVNIIRKGIGLPTRAGVSRFVTTLCIKKADVLKADSSLADAMIKAISGSIQDRSEPVRRSFAVALGYVFKFCSLTSMEKLITHLRNMYCEHDEKEHQSGATFSFAEISKHSADKFRDFETSILPLAYYGSHDQDETIKKVWSDVWEAHVGGSSMAVKRFLPELLALVSTNLKSASWPVKQQAAMTLASMAKTINDDLTAELDSILPLLMDALGGRSYPGKERVTEALCLVAISCKDAMRKRSDFDSIVKLFLKEAARRNKPYQRASLEYLGKFLQVYSDINVLDEVYEIVQPYLSQMEFDENAMDEDDGLTRPLFYVLRANAFRTLACALYKNADHDTTLRVWNDLGKGLNETASPWNIRLAILEGVDALSSVMNVKTLSDSEIKQIFDDVLIIMRDGRYASLRESAAVTTKKLVERLRAESRLSTSLEAELKQVVMGHASSEKVPNIQRQFELIFQK